MQVLLPALAALSLLVGCSLPTPAPKLQDLIAPEASLVKLAGDMKFTEGPVWLPSEEIEESFPGRQLRVRGYLPYGLPNQAVLRLFLLDQ